MTKAAFILALRTKLAGLPAEEMEERLSFYSEMIDDRMEEGSTEEEAVSAIGSVDQVAKEIMKSISLGKMTFERFKPKHKLALWEILLLSLGSPLWIAVAVTAFSLLFSLYAVLWSLVAAFWSVFVAFSAVGICGIPVGCIFAFTGKLHAGILMIGGGVAALGLAILLFFGCKAVTKWMAFVTGEMVLCVKRWFVRKEKIPC